MKEYCVGIGAANVDITGRSFNKLVMQDSNPGCMHVCAGGVTRNVLENLARLGGDCKLVTIIGNDVQGNLILKSCKDVGIDTSNIIIKKNGISSTYMAILADNGDMELALSDMRILQNLSPEELEKRKKVILNAKAVTLDPCLPEKAIEYIVENFSDKVPLFCDPVSTAYAKRIKPYVSKIHTIKPNKMELEVLTDMPCNSKKEVVEACHKLVEQGVKRVFVTAGSKGCIYYDYLGNSVFKSLKPVDYIVNASGAGDSFTSGIIYGFLNDLSIDETIDIALACGKLCILSEDTINPDMSIEMVKGIIERG